MRNLLPRTLALAAALTLTLACNSARDVAGGGASGCATCHGYPPPPFVAGGAAHTGETNCNACHAGTVQADNVTLVPGGLHLDGIVQGAGHAAGYAAPSVHGPDAIAFLAAAPGASGCTDCHGANFDGGLGPSCNACHATADADRPNFPGGVADWRANCTFCHGTPTEPFTASSNPLLAAPPQSVAGETDPALPGVGAHQKHLQGGVYSDAFECETCHAVPSGLAHVNGTAALKSPLDGTGQRQLPASLGTYTAATQTCAVYCHAQNGGSQPAPTWTGVASCNSCHGLPPPSTNPAVNGWHTGIAAHGAEPCASCHLGYGSGVSVDLALHVNGAKDAVFSHATTGLPTVYTLGWGDCTVCHRDNAAHAGLPNP